MSNATPAAGSTAITPGWQEDIRGMLAPFAAQMMWRLDLGSYEDVSTNASIIYDRISDPGNPMPPPPFPPLSQEQIQTFKSWMDHGCPQTSAPAAATAQA